MQDVVLKVGLPIALAVIMFGMGLGLTVSDFTRVFAKPKAFFVGAFLQVLLLPLTALLVVSVFGLSGALAVGMMLLAACPGGTTSNILTYIARGDIALSISLTAIISLLGFITVPLITAWALDAYLGEAAPALPVGGTMIGVLAITTVPVLLGMGVRRLSAGFADRAERFFKPASVVLFLLVVAAALISSRAIIVAYIAAAGTAVITLNLLTMGVAAGAATAIGLKAGQRTAITLECGLQNSTLGLVVALTFLESPEISIPVAVYGLLMLFSGFGYAWWARSSNGKLVATEERAS